MLFQALGLVIVALVTSQAAVTLYSLIRQHRGAQAILDRVVREARAQARQAHERAVQRQAQSDLSWTGYRKFEVRQKIIEDAGRQVCSFYLVPHDRRPLPPFLPGQYLTFQLDIPAGQLTCARCGTPVRSGGRFCTKCGGPVQANPTRGGKPTVRCYSLSDWHHPTQYRVTIKRVLPPKDRADVPPGMVSSFFHDSVNVGDILDVMAPRGKFCLDLHGDRPVVLIGGGVGITPVLTMLNAIAAANSPRETWFFYGVVNGADHVQKAHLERLARERPNLRLQVCYSSPRGADVLGKDYHHGGRVSVDLLKRVLPSNNYAYYICGPPPMMTSLVEGLEAWGVPSADIHFEAFGPATVKRTSQATKALTAQMKVQSSVTFAKSGKTCPWTPEVASLLELAEQNGVPMDSGCRVGNCNTCLTAIKQGEVSWIREPDSMPAAGSCLTCISIPKGTLVLDA